MNETEQMIADCEEREDRLSAWERNFIASISDWLNRGGQTLTEKQAETLDKIWDRVMEGGF